METGMGVVIIAGLIVLVIGCVIALIVDAWSMDKRRQAEKEITLAAIEAGLVQQPVPMTVLGPYSVTKQITELAWVKKK